MMKMNPTVSAGLVLLAVFAGGLLAGVLVERAMLTSPATAEASVERPERSHHGGDRLDRAEVARALGLSADQQARIDTILDEQQARIREIMTETRPRTREILKETKARIEAVLTPEQRAQWEAMHAARKRDDRNGRNR